MVRLACADDDAQGEALDVFWDYELDRRILEAEGWDNLATNGFDDPRQFAAFLNTLRWNTVTATDPNLFQSPFRAGIRIDAYQMEPLRKALRLPRVNLFIADDTGLGKTIEAGLIASELLLRKKAKAIVVAAPPSVLEQWKAELHEGRGGVDDRIRHQSRGDRGARRLDRRLPRRAAPPVARLPITTRIPRRDRRGHRANLCTNRSPKCHLPTGPLHNACARTRERLRATLRSPDLAL